MSWEMGCIHETRDMGRREKDDKEGAEDKEENEGAEVRTVEDTSEGPIRWKERVHEGAEREHRQAVSLLPTAKAETRPDKGHVWTS